MFDEDVAEGLRDLAPGDEVLVLTWLHQARRDVLRVHPRDDPANPEQGVFSTRSADRPNPIGPHRCASWRSTAGACACEGWRPSMGPRSST